MFSSFFLLSIFTLLYTCVIADAVNKSTFIVPSENFKGLADLVLTIFLRTSILSSVIKHSRLNSFIDSFTLLSIQNLSKNLTGIPGDAGLSWRFQGGFKRKNYFCLDCTIFNLSGGLGKSVKFYSNDI